MTDQEDTKSERQMINDPELTVSPTPPWTPLADTGHSETSAIHILGVSGSISGPVSTDPVDIPLPAASSSDDGLDDPAEPTFKTHDSDDAVDADVPLPPSPPNKATLPFRRPPGISPVPRRISTTGTTSGRRVSGAFQYALQPHPEPSQRQVSNTTSLDLRYYQEMKDQVSDLNLDDGSPSSALGLEGEEEEEVDDGNVERGVWDSSLGFGGTVPEMMHEEETEVEEEAWMGYVRQQLNTLFPDFFRPDPLHPLDHDVPASGGWEGEGMSVSTMNEATNGLPTPPFSGSLSRFPPGAEHGLQSNHGGEGGIRGMGSVGGVPNVRAELGGLKEEIERLRSVVSGLAEGMRSTQGECGSVFAPGGVEDSRAGDDGDASVENRRRGENGEEGGDQAEKAFEKVSQMNDSFSEPD